MPSAVSQTMIEVRAYEIWEQEGRPHGRAVEHWNKAVAELAPAKPVKAAPAAAKAKAPGKPAAKAPAKVAAAEAPVKTVKAPAKAKATARAKVPV